MNIPKFDEFAQIKEKERVDMVIQKFTDLFNTAVSSVEDIGRGYLLSHEQYEMINESFNLLKKEMNDLGWDFGLEEHMVMKASSVYPFKGHLICFYKKENDSE